MSSHQKVMLHGKENKLPDQLRNAGDLRVPKINYRYYRFVIAPELKAFPDKKGVPYGAGDNNRKEFLPFNTNSLFPIQARGEASDPETFFPANSRQTLWSQRLRYTVLGLRLG